MNIGVSKDVKFFEFKPIEISDRNGNREKFCVVPDSVESIKLAEIVTRVIKYSDDAVGMYRSVDKRYTEHLERVNSLKKSFWKRLAFLFKASLE
jgi:hypothetical protein